MSIRWYHYFFNKSSPVKKQLLNEFEQNIVIDLLDSDKTCLTIFCSH